MSRYRNGKTYASMKHLNNNLLCVIDVETTGLEVGKHDIIQLAILPLDNYLKPYKDLLPFDIEMKPKRPQNVDTRATKTHRINIAELIQRGLDPWDCVDLFEEWFQNLNLPIGRKLTPLAHNWPFDREFIKEWLGHHSFDNFFDGRYHDTLPIANFLNTSSNFRAERVPFPKQNLKYICTCLGIEHPNAHNALADCLVTAEIYRKMANAFRVII